MSQITADTDQNLRHALRLATRAPHDCLDTMMSRLDLRRFDHRQIFAAIQLQGFARLAAACRGEAAEAGPLMHRMRLMAADSGVAADSGLEQGAEAESRPLDADAVAYVLLGSQLGMTVLRQNLPPEERTGIFEQEPDLSPWKALANRLSRLPGDTAAARQTIDDACKAFAIFYGAAVDTMTLKSEVIR